MRKYAIEPAVIHVKAAQITALEVSTADVQHGFDVPDLHIKEPVRSGQPAVITLNHPPKGEYKVVCGIICGPHHEDMVAKLVVEEGPVRRSLAQVSSRRLVSMVTTKILEM